MLEQHHGSIAGKEAADGPQVYDNNGYEHYPRHQIQVEVSEVPSAGTLKIEMQQKDANAWMEIVGSPIDLTALTHEKGEILTLTAFVGKFRFTPSAGFDKTYSVYIHTVGL